MSKKIEGMANHVLFGGIEPDGEAASHPMDALGDVEMDYLLDGDEPEESEEEHVDELEEEGDADSGLDEDQSDDPDEDEVDGDVEEPEADDETIDGEEEEPEPEPVSHGSLDDPRYLELRDAFNKTQWQLQELQRQREEERNLIAAPEAPATQQIVEYARQNPVEAFNVAFAHADDDAITGIVSVVQSEAYAAAAEAAVLRDSGDEEGAARLFQDSQARAQLAQQMQYEHTKAIQEQALASVRAELEQSIAPHRDDRLTMNLQNAATSAFQGFVDEGVDISAHQAQIGAYLEQNPGLLGSTMEEAKAGFKQAVIQSVFGGQDGYIKHLVERQVAAQVGTNPPKVDKSRAIAGGTGSAARAPSKQVKRSQGEEFSDSLRSQQRSSKIAEAKEDVFKW